MLFLFFLSACGESNSNEKISEAPPPKNPDPIKVDDIGSSLTGDVAKDTQKVCDKEKLILKGLQDIDITSGPAIATAMPFINAVQQSLNTNVDLFLANQSQGYKDSYQNQFQATCGKILKAKESQSARIKDAAKTLGIKF